MVEAADAAETERRGSETELVRGVPDWECECEPAEGDAWTLGIGMGAETGAELGAEGTVTGAETGAEMGAEMGPRACLRLGV